MRRLVLILAFLLLPAASARAAWVPPRALDGSNAAVVSLGGVSVAREGTGAVGYVRTDGAWVARLAFGAWGAPTQIAPAPATDVKVAAGDGNRLAVAWISGGTVLASVADGAAFAPPAAVGGPGAENLDIDIGVDGVAYAVWEQAGDVRAARLDTTWTPLAAPLDIVPAAQAGTGALRPRVAVDAAGNALVVWGEAGADGTTHVYARRLIGTALSAFPREAAAAADSADVSTQYDGNFEWVVYRQLVGGVPHTFARHFLGSTFDPPAELDGGQPSDSPRVSIEGGGDGAAVFNAGNVAQSAVLAGGPFGAFGAAQTLGASGTGATTPDVSTTDEGNVAAVWVADGLAHGRFLEPGEPYQADTPLANPALGPVNAPGALIAGDRVGDYAVAFVQGPAGARTLSVAEYDRPPGRPSVPTSPAYARRARPTLRWAAGLELWGPQTFQVRIDGAVVGSTQAEKFIPPVRLKSGRHTFQIVAVDQAGQATPSRTRSLRVDAQAPTVRVAVSGARRAGGVLRVRVRAKDRGGSGLDHVTVAFGDRHSARGTTLFHAYRRRGRYTLKVSAFDRAGNVGRRTVRIRIR
jgi:PKD domain